MAHSTPEKRREYQRKYAEAHREQKRLNARLWKRRHRSHLNAKQRAYRKGNLEASRARARRIAAGCRARWTPEQKAQKNAAKRAYYALHKDRLAAESKAYRIANRERVLAVARANNRRLKLAALTVYGAGVAACVCCGEHRFPFLTIDHINNDGAHHRRRLANGSMSNGSSSGSSFYGRLKNQSYPAGFQTLCFNCNCGRAVNGGICPHAAESKESACG